MLREQTLRANRASPLDSLSAQLAIALIAAVLLPGIAIADYFSVALIESSQMRTSLIAATVALVLGLILLRKIAAFPGTRTFGLIIPIFAATYGGVAAVLLGLRLNYSNLLLWTSVTIATAIAFLIGHWLDRHRRLRFLMVPSGRTGILLEIPNCEWIVMREPIVPDDPDIAIVADLRWDHEDDWERMLAEAAIRGNPVYHTKQLRESLTGRVSIEHLSENSFGSLMPNLAYRNIKRLADLVGSILLLPFLALPMLAIAAAIRLDSRGPVLFRQERVGYRGRTFRMLKFRTMAPRDAAVDEEGARADAITRDGDSRVTRIGRFLRLSRLDELPQIVNILKGEMSLIGPRPEAVPLSRWYEREIPFYRYRHIVRPGITGWAQVTQGHVAELDDVDMKLNYDFYYIKNFSAWLDILIALRTIPTMISGLGAK